MLICVVLGCFLRAYFYCYSQMEVLPWKILLGSHSLLHYLIYLGLRKQMVGIFLFTVKTPAILLKHCG